MVKREKFAPRFIFYVLSLIGVLGGFGCSVSTPNGGIAFVIGAEQTNQLGANKTELVSQENRIVESKFPSAKVNAQGWAFLGSELDGICNTLVASPDGVLYVGGSFTTAGGVKVNHVAKWDGRNWSALGAGLASNVTLLALAPSGDLYAVWGEWSDPAKEGPCNLSKWDGSTWSTVGEKFAGSLGGPFEPAIKALAIASDGTLYAAGAFNKAGKISAQSIAKWDGSKWSPLGTGLDGRCNSLAISSDGTLYAGGDIIKAGKKKANLIAKWNGAAWSSLGKGLDGYKATVSDLKIGPDGMLYVVGRFTEAGGQEAAGFAKWYGSTWFPLEGTHFDDVGGPIAVAADGIVYAVAAYPGKEYLEEGILKWNGSKWSVIYRARFQEKNDKQDEYISALAAAPDGTLYAACSTRNDRGKEINYITMWNDTK